MVILKSRDEIAVMREAGRVVALTLEAIKAAVRPGVCGTRRWAVGRCQACSPVALAPWQAFVLRQSFRDHRCGLTNKHVPVAGVRKRACKRLQRCAQRLERLGRRYPACARTSNFDQVLADLPTAEPERALRQALAAHRDRGR